MITREMIRNGFESGTVSIEEEYAGCIGICCRIGDNAFYFLGSEDDDLTKEEYWESYTLDMTIDMIFNILKDVESAEEHGLDETELDYYTSVLAYQPNETKISLQRIKSKPPYYRRSIQDSNLYIDDDKLNLNGG